MTMWQDVPEETRNRLAPPPDRENFLTQDQFEEALGYWQKTVGRNLGFVMQRYEASLPYSTEYSVGTSSAEQAHIVIKTQKIAWNGRLVGESKEQILSIKDIEKLVEFCFVSGNKDLVKAVQRPFLSMTSGPD
ncbi:hypothetical protein N9X00_07230 [Gammaproteobacteria bacterium]|jgi:hypothetical protein|nr:hypothetical protein [Gammaproteobacteria bacterium]